MYKWSRQSEQVAEGILPDVSCSTSIYLLYGCGVSECADFPSNEISQAKDEAVQ